jgi:GNAT superfamily N-acetyltransferase
MNRLHQIALAEEARQALGTAEISLEAEPIAGGWMGYGGKGTWANQAAGLGLNGPVTDDELDRLVEFYTSRGVQPQIEVCPFVDESLIAGLAKRGFLLREFENVFAREIADDENLRAVYPHQWPKDLVIEHVDPSDDGAVEQLVEVATSGFRPPDEPISDVFRDISINMVKHKRSDSFLALIDGKPVGGASMESTPEIACLFGTSVVPTFRRRGIQSILMILRMERARERGSRLVAIHSNPGISTERNAMRLGFFLAYTKCVMTMPREGLLASP